VGFVLPKFISSSGDLVHDHGCSALECMSHIDDGRMDSETGVQVFQKDSKDTHLCTTSNNGTNKHIKYCRGDGVVVGRR
jgi:hypothetical protein